MQLSKPKIECEETSEKYGRFIVEPLETGAGITLGNALRRMLLNSLPGAAVTWIKVEGVPHEFSALPHIKEDATEFMLNVKALRLRPLSNLPGKLTLDVEGEGQVCAGDIKPSADFEIVNPELYLASLDSSEAKLCVEFNVEVDKGYRPAKHHDGLPIGVIPVDAIFTPVRKVNFTTEPMHVGRETGHERLYLEVWTDGTIAPADAISLSAAILMEQLTPFVDYGRVSKIDEEKKALRESIPEDLYNMTVEQLDLSVRAMNCLRRSGINTIGELISTGEKELMSLRNFGQKSRQEIDERLEALGLSLSPVVEEPEIQPVKKSKGKPSEEPGLTS